MIYKLGEEDLSAELDIAQESQIPSPLFHTCFPSIMETSGLPPGGFHKGRSERPSLRVIEQHNLGSALIRS